MRLYDKELVKERFKIWFIQYDEDGNEIGRGVHAHDYAYRGRAFTNAREYFGDRKKCKYVVAQRDPWKTYSRKVHCDICGRMYDCPENVHGALDNQYVHLRKGVGRGMAPLYVSCPDCTQKVADFIDSIRGEAARRGDGYED